MKINSIALISALFSATQIAAQQLPDVTAERTAVFGSAPEFTAEAPVTQISYDSGYLGSYIDAPLQLVEFIYLPKPPDEVFPAVHSGNADWARQIETLSWDHSSSKSAGALGVGSLRRCDFVGGAGTAYEEVFAFEENRLFAYNLDLERSSVPLPVEDFFVIWTLEDKGDAGTLVTVRVYFDERQDMGGNAVAAVKQSLSAEFRNFANLYGGTYVTM